jgi:hypothetical protein
VPSREKIREPVLGISFKEVSFTQAFDVFIFGGAGGLGECGIVTGLVGINGVLGMVSVAKKVSEIHQNLNMTILSNLEAPINTHLPKVIPITQR